MVWNNFWRIDDANPEFFWSIDKLYTQIGNEFCLPWELNLLLSCGDVLSVFQT